MIARSTAGTVVGIWLLFSTGLHAEYFTTGEEPALRFGVHEVVLDGGATGGNPFSTPCQVRFVAPSATSLTVDCFYDGNGIWRARLYVQETGTWHWSAESGNPRLARQKGAFEALNSPLRGKLRQHVADPKHWMTDDGRWFLNLSDTAYRLFNPTVPAARFRDYLRDADLLGFSSLRVAALGGWLWHAHAKFEGKDASNWPWAGDDLTRYNLARFQTTDQRLRYMLQRYPDVYVQMIMLGLVEWGVDAQGNTWNGLPPEVRQHTLRYMLARWAAFPQVFWLIVNDLHVGEEFPGNRAFAREVGRFLQAHDPWHNLLAVGPAREESYPFISAADLNWSSYIHIETYYSVAATHARAYADVPVHVFNGEDRYEHDYSDLEPQHPQYFYRRLFWSWLLSGGSTNYGSRFPYIHPYRLTGALPAGIREQVYTERLIGADSLIHIQTFFQRFHISLAEWEPADERARDLDGHGSTPALLRWWFGDDSRRVQCMVSGDLHRVLVYHPNAAEGFVEEGQPSGRAMKVHPLRRARFELDLRDVKGPFHLTWLRVRDGIMASGGTVSGNAEINLEAPWKGEDVAAYLSPVRNSVSTDHR